MKTRVTVLILLMLIWSTITVNACTLYAANGDAWVSGGGTLLAKNRDELPEIQDIRLVTPHSGFRYFGLLEIVDGVSHTKAGVNEYGLAVVSATAGTIPAKERSQQAHFKAISHYLLTHYKSVDEVLQDGSKFYGPLTLMLADKDKVAYVEIGLNGMHAIHVMSNGTLAHTNHFLEEQMRFQNLRAPGDSSSIRYNRIVQLLADTVHPLTINDFVKFSEDRSDGEDNSIWRIGSNIKKPQTMAAFIVHIARDGMPDLYVKVRKKPEDKGKEEIYRLSFEQMFQTVH